MHSSRKTQDASNRATQLIFMEVRGVVLTAGHTVVRSSVTSGLWRARQVAPGGFAAGNRGCTFQLLPERLAGNGGGHTSLGHCRSWEDLILGPD